MAARCVARTGVVRSTLAHWRGLACSACPRQVPILYSQAGSSSLLLVVRAVVCSYGVELMVLPLLLAGVNNSIGAQTGIQDILLQFGALRSADHERTASSCHIAGICCMSLFGQAMCVA